MVWVVIDVEADGPCPGLFSMVSFGAVALTPELDITYFGQTYPISEEWEPEALKVNRITREEHLTYPAPEPVMIGFAKWLDELGSGVHPVFVSDNPAFDWQWINYYLHRYVGRNPFGFSARRIGDMYAGWKGNVHRGNDWKKLRKTAHTHHPVDDAKGNAEALLAMHAQGLSMPVWRPQ